jgi:acyl-homoserine-lactone acylase
LSSEALDAWAELSKNHPLIGPMFNRGVVVLPGSDSLFEWQDDPAARDPGVVAFAGMPQVERMDYVFNANDSFWMPNSAALIEGDFSPMHGLQRMQRSLRTRNNDLTLSGRSPDDPNGEDDKFSLEEMAAALLSNRSYTAELLKPELVSACKEQTRARGRAGQVELGEACAVLEAWNNRFDLDARGAVLFREWIGQYDGADLNGKGKLFAVDFDPADPVGTPRGLADRELAVRYLAQAVEVLQSAGHALDVPLGELQYPPSKLPERIAIHGGHGAYEGVMNMQQGSTNTTTLEPLPLGDPVEGSRFLTTEGYPVVHGSSFLMALEFTDGGPRAQAFLTYGQSGDPTSTHFRDQSKLYSAKQWRPILFEEAAVAADTQSDRTITAGSDD